MRQPLSRARGLRSRLTPTKVRYIRVTIFLFIRFEWSNGLKVAEKNLPATKVACMRVSDIRCVSYHHNDHIKMTHEIIITQPRDNIPYTLRDLVSQRSFVYL